MKTTNELVQLTSLSNVLTPAQLKAFKKKHRNWMRPAWQCAHELLKFCEENGIEATCCEGIYAGNILHAFNCVNGQYVDVLQELGLKENVLEPVSVLRVFESMKELYEKFFYVKMWGISLQGIYLPKKNVTCCLNNDGTWSEYDGFLEWSMLSYADSEWHHAFDEYLVCKEEPKVAC